MGKPKLDKNDTKLTKGERGYLSRVVNEFYSKAEPVLQDIKNKRDELLGESEEEVGLIRKIEKHADDIESLKENLVHAHDLIFESEEEEEPLYDQIDSFLEAFKAQKSKIEHLGNKIANYRTELLGYEDEEGNHEPGIKDQVDHYVDSLDKLVRDNTERQNDLFEEIEDLLEGASTVALAKAFEEHKVSFNKVNTKWEWVFFSAIALMMGISIAAFYLSDYKFQEMWKYTLGNLPFIGGAVWLAIYASKQRSQNKRLQQEYAYKEDVAKVYIGLKKEIDELGGTELGEKLNEQVLSLIVEVVALNPSDTLDSNSHNDRGPIMEAFSKITNKEERPKS